MDKGEPSQPPAKRQRSGKEAVGSIFEPGLAENEKKEVVSISDDEKEKEIGLHTVVARLDQIESTQQLILEQNKEIVNMLRSYVPTLERLSRQDLRLSGRDLRLNVDPPEVEIREDIQGTQGPMTGGNEVGPSGEATVAAGTMGNVNVEPEEDEDDEEDDSDESLGYDWT